MTHFYLWRGVRVSGKQFSKSLTGVKLDVLFHQQICVIVEERKPWIASEGVSYLLKLWLLNLLCYTHMRLFRSIRGREVEFELKMAVRWHRSNLCNALRFTTSTHSNDSNNTRSIGDNPILSTMPVLTDFIDSPQEILHRGF